MLYVIKVSKPQKLYDSSYEGPTVEKFIKTQVERWLLWRKGRMSSCFNRLQFHKMESYGYSLHSMNVCHIMELQLKMGKMVNFM